MSVIAVIFLIPYLLVKGLYNTVFDNTSVISTNQKGKEVIVAPFSNMEMRRNYGGWTDQYLYFGINKSKDELPSDAEYSTYKVIDEKSQTSLLYSTKSICILENVAIKDQIAQINCESLERLNNVTKSYKDTLTEIEKNGSLYVKDFGLNYFSLKKIFKLHRYSIYEIKNENDLRKYMSDKQASEQHGDYQYVRLLDSKDLVNIKDYYDEVSLAKTNFNYAKLMRLQEDTNINSETYVESNVVPGDMEKWINLKFSNAQDRWVMRTYISMLNQILIISKDLKELSAEQFLSDLRVAKRGLSYHYSNQQNGDAQIELATQEFLKNPERAIIFSKIQSDALEKKDEKGLHKVRESFNWTEFEPPIDCLKEVERC